MEKFEKLTGVAVPFGMPNVDTDMIIPKQFLKTIKRAGLGKALFFERRYDDDGKERSDFVLNQPAYRNARILVAGENFGCGSSREHAPWALQDFGFQAIVAESFADIFSVNCGKVGLLTVTLAAADVRELLDSAPAEATIDLEAQAVTLSSGRRVAFEIDASTRERLLNGWDDIALTELREGEIERYEAERERDGPNALAI